MDVPIVMLVAPAIALLLLVHYLTPTIDPQEPPLVKAKIPFVGHLLGLLRYGIPYYTRLSAQHAEPAFTVDLLISKVYVLNSANLVAAVQRNSKIISFAPFLTAAAKRMAGIKGDGLKLLQETGSGGGGVNKKVVHAMHPTLLGSGLDEMNRGMITNLQMFMDALATEGERPLDLLGWCRHVITIASTESVYGPLNPYRSKEVEDAFWIFESNLNIILMDVMPHITARKAYQARETVVASFLEYYAANGQMNASALAHIRWKTQSDAGATTEDIARLETATGFGILSNTVPSTFWTLFEIYSRPELLSELRKEVMAEAVTFEGNVCTVDLANIRDRCTLLVSTFQEMLRLRPQGALTRFVNRDILLAERYLLKAGSVVQMSSKSVNREQSTWGTDAEEFDPWRFVRRGSTNEEGNPPSKQQSQQQRATGFMSFGASPNMCPGRHFASGEILGMTAMMILRYDISPVNAGAGAAGGGGRWTPPKVNPHAMAASIAPPMEEFPVVVTRSKWMDDLVDVDVEACRWVFRVTEGKGRFNLIIG